MELELGGISIPYSVRESENVSRPRVEYRGIEFTVVVPAGSNLDAEAFLERNEAWVLEQWEKFEEFREKIPNRDFSEGSSIEVMGVEREIVFERRRSNFLGDEVVLARHLVERSSVKDQLEKLLRSEFREEIESRLELYETNFSRPYNKVYVRDQRTRWGSCSSKGNLSFNWRLILGPEHLLDYIVVHELAHLEHRDHGEEFWNKVEKVLPGYGLSREWLKNNSCLLIWNTSSSKNAPKQT